MKSHFYRYETFFLDHIPEHDYRVTLSVVRDDENQKFNVAFAFCSGHDFKNFRKDLGRTIANGRLGVSKSINVPYAAVDSYKGVMKAALSVLLKNERPAWCPRRFYNFLSTEFFA